MSKPFKTYEELIEILKQRNLNIEPADKTYANLAIYGYYNIVTGYKKPFLKNVNTEDFIDGISFDNIKLLYEFDNSLRTLLFPFLNTMELFIKNIIVHEFAKQYGELGYTTLSNYNIYNQKSKDKALSVISFLNDHINKSKQDCIVHYKKKHGEVPIWVLFTTLTFGTVQQFFEVLHPLLKLNIIKIMNTRFNTNMSLMDFGVYLNAFVALRNSTAHRDRIYCYKRIFIINQNNRLVKQIKKPLRPLDTVFIGFYEILPKDTFVSLVNHIINSTQSILNPIPQETLKNIYNELSYTPEILVELSNIDKTK